jgi:hypothetical protein|tara:strand:+ start:1179 stop:1370 length:192 start_codon:yes stop_codon:yes gene_type:complete
MSWWSKIVDAVTGTERKEVRTRNKKGQYVGDDESTPNVDESRTTVRVKKSRRKNKRSGRKKWK